MKHESLIDKQRQLSVHQAALKAKYNPIFEQMEKIMHDKKMEYMDHMTTNLESNFDKCTLEK